MNCSRERLMKACYYLCGATACAASVIIGLGVALPLLYRDAVQNYKPATEMRQDVKPITTGVNP